MTDDQLPVIEPTTIIYRARRILAANGRTIGELVDLGQYHWDGLARDECPVCVIGAINIAAGLDPDDPWTTAVTEDHRARVRAAMAATGLLARHLGLIRTDQDLQDSAFLMDEVGNRWHDEAPDDAVFAALDAVAGSEASR